MDLKRLIEFVAVTHQLQAIARATDVPGGTRPENDLEHSAQLAFIAWYSNEKSQAGLDPYRILGLSLVHDLVEIHAGDTPVYGDETHLNSQAGRERQAAKQLKRDWPDLPALYELIAEYEACATPEAKFVYSLDKLAPMLNNYLDGGRSWRQKGVHFAQVKAAKTGKADRSPVVAPYFAALLTELEGSPQLFAPPASKAEPTSASSDSETYYLQRARQLAALSEDRIGCGTVIVRDGKVLSEAANSQRADKQAVFHSEVKAVMTANQVAGDRTLRGATAYSSCEPCAMCLAALSYAKVGRIVYDKTIADLAPDRPQSRFDSQAFVKTLDFVPKLEHRPLN